MGLSLNTVAEHVQKFHALLLLLLVVDLLRLVWLLLLLFLGMNDSHWLWLDWLLWLLFLDYCLYWEGENINAVLLVGLCRVWRVGGLIVELNVDKLIVDFFDCCLFVYWLVICWFFVYLHVPVNRWLILLMLEELFHELIVWLQVFLLMLLRNQVVQVVRLNAVAVRVSPYRLWFWDV